MSSGRIFHLKNTPAGLKPPLWLFQNSQARPPSAGPEPVAAKANPRIYFNFAEDRHAIFNRGFRAFAVPENVHGLSAMRATCSHPCPRSRADSIDSAIRLRASRALWT